MSNPVPLRRLLTLSSALALALAIFASCSQFPRSPAGRPGTASFEKEVAPLLEERCLPCHNGRVLEGRLNLSSRATALEPLPSGGAAIVPGDPGASKVLTVVLAAARHPQAMPPTGHGLSEVEIETLEKWIRGGAPWPGGTPGHLAPAPGAEPRSR